MTSKSVFLTGTNGQEETIQLVFRRSQLYSSFPFLTLGPPSYNMLIMIVNMPRSQRAQCLMSAMPEVLSTLDQNDMGHACSSEPCLSFREVVLVSKRGLSRCTLNYHSALL